MRTLAASALFLLLSPFALAQNTTPAKPAAPPPKAEAEAAPAKIDPAKEADIRHLLELTGAANLASEAMARMESNLRPLLMQALPPGDYRDRLIDLFFEKFHTKANGQLVVDLAVPIYDKYYSADEIKGLIQFYGTPLGQKTAKILPQLMGELQTAGQQMGEQLGRDSMTEVLAEHPELKKALEDAKAAATLPR